MTSSANVTSPPLLQARRLQNFDTGGGEFFAVFVGKGHAWGEGSRGEPRREGKARGLPCHRSLALALTVPRQIIAVGKKALTPPRDWPRPISSHFLHRTRLNTEPTRLADHRKERLASINSPPLEKYRIH